MVVEPDDNDTGRIVLNLPLILDLISLAMPSAAKIAMLSIVDSSDVSVKFLFVL